jgi:hypothetical protein
LSQADAMCVHVTCTAVITITAIPSNPPPRRPPCPHHHTTTHYTHMSYSPLACAPQVQQYEVRRHALFFTDPSCRAMYRAHVAALAGRRNSVTGSLYRDDPTIMAWDLVNEPRCESWAVPECPQMLQVITRPPAVGPVLLARMQIVLCCWQACSATISKGGCSMTCGMAPAACQSGTFQAAVVLN